MYWDPKPEIFFIPYFHFPISWYGFLFMLGFVIGAPVFSSILRRFFSHVVKYNQSHILEINNKVILITDRMITCLFFSIIIGSRIGHFLFYEVPSNYWKIFSIKEGLSGLSGHGAAIGVILGIIILSIRIKKIDRQLTWIRLLDLLSVSVPLHGVFIRIGNFMNQEILGSQTSLPWGVVFGHPAEHCLLVPRHPVQLYEAFFYLGVCFLLWRLTYRPKFLLKEGRLAGIFFMLLFGFRFLVECLKLEQSHLLESSGSIFTMGQILSIPLFLLGVYLTTRKTPNSPITQRDLARQARPLD